MLLATNITREIPTPAVAIAASSFVLLLAACGSGGDEQPSGNASITNANNYKASGTLNVPHVTTAPGADLNVCWPSLTQDILCHEVAPKDDILATTFLRIPNMTEKEITAQFTTGTFDAGVVDLYVMFKVAWEPGATCAPLSKFKLGGKVMEPATDYVVDAKYKYLLLFAASEAAGEGTKSLVFLDPTEGSTITQVDAPNGCPDVLSFDADLTTPQPVNIPAQGPYVIEWSKLTQDGLGKPVTFLTIDSLIVAFYATPMTVAELEAKALDYDRIATVLYQVPIVDGATSVDLTLAKTSDGTPFTDFSRTDGFWAVGLLCSTCQIPAPIAVAILNPT